MADIILDVNTQSKLHSSSTKSHNRSNPVTQITVKHYPEPEPKSGLKPTLEQEAQHQLKMSNKSTPRPNLEGRQVSIFNDRRGYVHHWMRNHKQASRQRPRDIDASTVHRILMSLTQAMTLSDHALRHERLTAGPLAPKSRQVKVNASSIPRCDSRIKDHDPDKINFQNVVRFLDNRQVYEFVESGDAHGNDMYSKPSHSKEFKFGEFSPKPRSGQPDQTTNIDPDSTDDISASFLYHGGGPKSRVTTKLHRARLKSIKSAPVELEGTPRLDSAMTIHSVTGSVDSSLKYRLSKRGFNNRLPKNRNIEKYNRIESSVLDFPSDKCRLPEIPSTYRLTTLDNFTNSDSDDKYETDRDNPSDDNNGFNSDTAIRLPLVTYSYNDIPDDERTSPVDAQISANFRRLTNTRPSARPKKLKPIEIKDMVARKFTNSELESRLNMEDRQRTSDSFTNRPNSRELQHMVDKFNTSVDNAVKKKPHNSALTFGMIMAKEKSMFRLPVQPSTKPEPAEPTVSLRLFHRPTDIKIGVLQMEHHIY